MRILTILIAGGLTFGAECSPSFAADGVPYPEDQALFEKLTREEALDAAS